MKNNFKEVKISEILEESDFKEAHRLILLQDWQGLRKFLNSIQDKLEKHGLLADYLYYQLEWRFKT